MAGSKETGGRFDLVSQSVSGGLLMVFPSRQVEPVLREQKPPTYLAAGSILSVNQCPVDTD